MSMIKHCDKCGKVILTSFDCISLKSDTDIKIGLFNSTRTIDLCGPCVNRFKLWLNEAIKKEVPDIIEEMENHNTEKTSYFISLCDADISDINAANFFEEHNASTHIVHCLARGGFDIGYLVDDIINNDAYELRRVRTVGKKTVDDIIQLLIDYNLLKEETK